MGTELQFREISPQKSVRDDNFPQGVIDFNFSTGSPTCWIPAKSYFRLELNITGLAGANQPTRSEQLALADSCPSTLFDNIYFKASGQDVSSCVNYVPQAQALKNRLSKTGAWMNSIGKSAYGIESSFQKRVDQVCVKPVVQLDVSNRANPNAGTVAYTTATGAVVGVNTEFTRFKVGDTLYIVAQAYIIRSITTDLAMVVQSGLGGNVAPTANAYVVASQTETPSANRSTIFVCWTPCIGIFDHGEPLGAGDWRLSLNPNSNYKLAGVESTQGLYNAPIAAPANFNLLVKDLKFYCCTIKESIPQGISTLYLMEPMVQSKPISGAGVAQYEFTVPSSTKALTVFIQSGRAGSNPLCPPSKFTCLADGVVASGSERLLRSLQITFANTTKPSTRWGSAYTLDGVAPTINELQQRYNDSLSESGLLQSSGGAESLDEWLLRGCYYHYSFNRDASDKSTQVQVSLDFAAAETGANVFLVCWFSRAIELTTQGGSIQAVRSLSV